MTPVLRALVIVVLVGLILVALTANFDVTGAEFGSTLGRGLNEFFDALGAFFSSAFGSD